MTTPDFAARLAALTAEPSRDEEQDAHRLARVERTRGEMMTQGTAVRTTLAQEAEVVGALAGTLSGRRIDRVVIAGCGDSWFVGMAVRHAWEILTGIPTEPAQALDYAAYGAAAADGATLAIGLSAGGNTPAVMAALSAARERGAFTVGLSNTAGSPLAQQADAGLRVHAMRKGWPTQSSMAACALLIGLAAEIGRARGRDPAPILDALEGVPAAMDALAAELDPQMAALADWMATARLLLFTGLGPNYAAAGFGAAKVKELSPVHAIAIPLEEMHHYRLPKRGDPVFIVATDQAARERALDTALVGHAIGAHGVAVLCRDDPEITAHVEAVVRVPELPAALAPLLSSIPLHLFAYHFAKARFARDLA